MRKIKKLLLLLICISVYVFFAVASTDLDSGSSNKATATPAASSPDAKEASGKKNPDTPAPTSTPKPNPVQMYVSDVKPNIEELSEYQIGQIVGVYISANGRAISLFSDGTARQVYNPYKQLEAGDTWQYKDGTLSIKSPMQNCVFTVRMNIPESEPEDSDETSGDNTAPKEDEGFELVSSSEDFEHETIFKVRSESKILTMDEYKEIIGDYYPEALITPSPTLTPTPTLSPTPTPSPSPTPIPKEKAVSLKVTNKTTRKTTLQEFSVFSIDITNNTDRAIRGVRGIFTINDLFGKKIAAFEVDFTGKTIKAKSKASYEKNMEMNQFIDYTVKIYKEKYDDLSFSFKVEKIVYEDEVRKTKSTTKGSTSVSVECINKKNVDADILNGIYSDYSSFEFKITNNTSKDIKGIEGNFRVYNLFGDCILKGGADFTGKKIPAGGSTKMTISKEINMFDDDDLAVRREKYDDLYFEYEILTIVNY